MGLLPAKGNALKDLYRQVNARVVLAERLATVPPLRLGLDGHGAEAGGGAPILFLLRESFFYNIVFNLQVFLRHRRHIPQT